MAFTPILICDLSAHQTPQHSGSPNASFSSRDFNKLKNAGVKGVIFRVIGYRGGKVQVDASFESGYQKAKAAGLYVGAYHYISQNFKTRQNGINDAKLMLKQIKGKDLKLGVWADVEDSSIVGDKKGITSALQGWCDTIEDNGFYAGIYANKSWFNSKMNVSDLSEYAFWVAYLPFWKVDKNGNVVRPVVEKNNSLKSSSSYSPRSNTDFNKTIRNNCQIWQFSWFYQVKGFYNGDLDINWCYVNIPNAVKNITTGSKTSSGNSANKVSKKSNSINFTPKKSEPEPNSVYYSTTGKNMFQNELNGFNRRNATKNNIYKGSGNCTWYASGRFSEIQGNWKLPIINPKAGNGKHAENWIKGKTSPSTNNKQPILNPDIMKYYTTKKKPELGAVVVWRNSNGTKGHVAVIEHINDDGSFLVSESNWSHQFFRPQVKVPKSCDYNDTLKFAAMIYNPAIHDAPVNNKKPTKVKPSNVKDNGSATQVKKYLSWITEDSSQSNPLKLGYDAMRNNAILTYLFLRDYNFSLNAISAILGNAQVESNINPAVYQGFVPTGNPDDTNMGYGLFQWTPPSKILNWLENGDYSPIDGDAQLYWLMGLTGTNPTIQGEWLPNQDPEKAEYYEPFDDFYKDTTHTVSWLSRCFQYSLLRGGYSTAHDRASNSQQWKAYLSGSKIADLYAQAPGDVDPDGYDYFPLYDDSTDQINETPDDSVPYVRGKKHLIFIQDNEPLLF